MAQDQFLVGEMRSCKPQGEQNKHKPMILRVCSENLGVVFSTLHFNKSSRSFHGLLSSVQFSRSVMSDSLRPHESQHARPPCPSPTPGVHSDSRPLSQWCHPAISSSVVPFSSCPQSLPASESFPMSQLFTWGGQITAVSALASFLPKKSQGWSLRVMETFFILITVVPTQVHICVKT